MNRLAYSTALLFVIVIVISLFATPALGEHATCNTGELNNGDYSLVDNNNQCGVLMNWNWIFENTDSEFQGVYSQSFIGSEEYEEPNSTGSYEFPDQETSEQSEDLLGPTKSSHRNLYHGIWTDQEGMVSEVVTGKADTYNYVDSEYSDYSNKYIPWTSSSPLSRPPHLSVDYRPNWWGISTSLNDRVSLNEEEDRLVLEDSVESFNFTTWSGGDDSDFIDRYLSDYGQDAVPVEEDMWNTDVWRYRGKFEPKYVLFSGNIPKNTTVRIEVFELPEDEEEDDTESGNIHTTYQQRINNQPETDSQIEENPEEYLLGYAEIQGSQESYGQNAIRDFTSPLTPVDDEDGIGLSEYQRPEYDGYSGGLFGGGTSEDPDASVHHIRISLERDDTDTTSPKIAIGNSITLTEEPPSYRDNNKPWGTYPQILPSFTGDTDGRELMSISNKQEDGLNDDLIVGHSEDMLGNFNDTYIGNKTASHSPMIPRDYDTGDPDSRFYHAEVDSDYHLPDNFNIIHHAYADIPRVERSFEYQDDYDLITANQWDTVASDEGSIYAIFDAATNSVGDNTNFNYYSDEDSRYYNNLANADIPSNSSSSYSDEDLKSNAILMQYEIQSIEVKPEIGAEYDTTEENFLEEEYVPLQTMAESYSQEDIDDLEDFEGFYASISNIRVNYSIDYGVLEFQASSCPAKPPSWTPEFEEVNNETVITNWPSSARINSGYDEEDSDIYSSYTDYINSNYGTELSVDSADGRGACSDEDDERLSGNSWRPTTWDYAESIVNHDDGNVASYELSDNSDISNVESESVEDETKYVYDVEEFASERADEQGPDDGDIGDSFSTKLALGQDEFGSKTYFNRDIQSDGVEDTRWSRAEALTSLERDTLVFDQKGGERTERFTFPSETRLGNTFEDATDYSSESAIPGEMADNVKVYLDVYNYGPTRSFSIDTLPGDALDESLEIELNGTTIYDGSIPETGGHMTYEKLQITGSEHNFNLTSLIDEGQSSVELNFTYEGESVEDYSTLTSGQTIESLTSAQVDPDGTIRAENDSFGQRFEYVLTFETNRPLQDIYSRWDYSTFRDTRYDVTYAFKSQECATQSDSDCYDYQEHGVPITTLWDQNRATHNSSAQGVPRPTDKVDTYYPSNSMFVRPYLMPTTSSILTTDPLGIGSNVRPTETASDYVEDNYDVFGDSPDDNLMSQSHMKTEVDGEIITYDPFDYLDQQNLTFFPREKFDNIPKLDTGQTEGMSMELDEDSNYVFVSEDLHYLSEYSDPSVRENITEDALSGLSYVDPFDFPATAVKNDETESFDSANIEADNPGILDTNDLSIQKVWFEDGRYYMEVSPTGDYDIEHNPSDIAEGVQPKFSGSFELRILDFPTGYVGNWRDWGGIDEDKYENGLMFGGHDRTNLDNLRDNDEDFWEDKFEVTNCDEEDSDFIGPCALTNFAFHGTAEYQGNSEFWLVEADEVQSDVNTDSDIPIYVDYLDYSPIESDYCAKDFSAPGDERYCDTTVDNMASFNVENAISKDNTDHIRSGYVPVQDSTFDPTGGETDDDDVTYNTDEEPYIEYSEFEFTSYSRYSDWYVAGDASWETRKAQKSGQTRLFDEVEISVDPVNNITSQLTQEEIEEYRESPVQHTFDDNNEDDKQQYRVRITDNNGNPISLKNRIDSIDMNGDELSLADLDDELDEPEEGLCIELEGGQLGESDNCYMTGEDGYLYFYVDTSSSSVEPGQSLDRIIIDGSSEQWWEYSGGQRMIESASISIGDEEFGSGNDEATLGETILILLVVIVSFAFVAAMMSRIRANPSTGWTTKDVLDTMFKPFIYLAISRLGDIIIYLVLAGIGFGVLVSSLGSGNISPFFVFEVVIGELLSAIASLL